MVEIRELSDKELNGFVNFPFALYKMIPIG